MLKMLTVVKVNLFYMKGTTFGKCPSPFPVEIIFPATSHLKRLETDFYTNKIVVSLS